MTLFFVLVIISVALLVAEYLNISYCIHKIPLRILVNGTRGKSSVTKYIAAGLRAADKKTLAKITGIIPTIIYPDGSNKIIKRIAPARVQEQFKLIRLATKLSADCLVLECMSITPYLQKLESKIFKPNIYVITNIRDDHQEQMGNEKEQVKSICNSIPQNSIVVTNEKRNLFEIEKSVKSKKSSLVFADDFNIKIPDGSFESNCKIASAVCNIAGIEEAKARNAIVEEIRKTESLLYKYNCNGVNVKFLNGFAVNDVSSAKDFLDYWENKLGEFKKLNLIFNSRSDRPLRSLAFAKWFGAIKNLNRIILIGSHIPWIKLELIRNGMESSKISVWTKRKIKSALEYLKEIAEPDSIFVGLGNIADEGLLFINSLKENTLLRTDNDN